MFRKVLLPVATVLTLLAVSASADNNRHRSFRVFAKLVPTEEVPAVSSGASGFFRATVDPANQTISYQLSYEGLEGATAMAHIHIGQRRVNGGISVWLCGNPPPPTVPPAPFPQPQPCPASPATITGTLTAADLFGPVPQGVEQASPTTNDFDELVAMIRRGLTYANVHSARFPGGEVRGQIQTHDHRHH